MDSTEYDLETERSLALKHMSLNKEMKGRIQILDRRNERLTEEARALEVKWGKDGYLLNQLQDFKNKNIDLTKKLESMLKHSKEKSSEICLTVSIGTFTQSFPPERPATDIDDLSDLTHNENLARDSHDDLTNSTNSGISDDEYLSPAGQHNLKSQQNTFVMHDMYNSLSTIEIPKRIRKLRKKVSPSSPLVKKNLFNLASFYDTEAMVGDAAKESSDSDFNLNTSINVSDFINDTEPTFGKLAFPHNSPVVQIGNLDMKQFENKYGISNNSINENPRKRRRKFYISSSSDSQ